MTLSFEVLFCNDTPAQQKPARKKNGLGLRNNTCLLKTEIALTHDSNPDNPAIR
jgi:hypothetical protein